MTATNASAINWLEIFGNALVDYSEGYSKFQAELEQIDEESKKEIEAWWEKYQAAERERAKVDAMERQADAMEDIVNLLKEKSFTPAPEKIIYHPGYIDEKKLDNTLSIKRNKINYSERCGDTFDCPSGYYCNSGLCTKRPPSKRKKNSRPGKLICINSPQCPDRYLCDQEKNKCIKSVEWVRKYANKNN